MGYIVYAVIVVILAFALQPSQPQPKKPSLSDLNVPTVGQGKPIPKVFGRRIVQSPTIVWFGDLGYNKIKASGGK
ncbi:MAG: hypothetical protein JKY62_16735 [Desulfocapsa sp.]|nr:hypothetical protein [Desulfocapsa sp.]